MSKVSEAMTQVLADSYALYLKTQNYHWNVEGPYFKSLHELFELQYTDLAAAIDEIAERIRALGAKAPGSFSAFSKLTSIKEGSDNLDAFAMVRDLHDDQLKLSTALGKAIKAAQEVSDEVTIGMLTERQTVHQKNAWMLRSSLPQEEAAKLQAA